MSHSRVMPASLRSSARASLERARECRLSHGTAHAPDPGHYGGAGPSTSPAMSSAMVSYRFEKVIYLTQPQTVEALTAGATVYLTREAPRQPL